jgi:hypothetical protein
MDGYIATPTAQRLQRIHEFCRFGERPHQFPAALSARLLHRSIQRAVIDGAGKKCQTQLIYTHPIALLR